MRTRKNIQFEFVIESLAPLDVTVKPVFGMFALYVNRKIMFGLRDCKENPETRWRKNDTA